MEDLGHFFSQTHTGPYEGLIQLCLNLPVPELWVNVWHRSPADLQCGDWMSCLQAASGNRIHRPIGMSPLTRGALLLHTWIWGVAEQCSSSFRSFQGTDSRQGYPTRAVCTSCTLSIPLLSTHGRIDLFLFAEVCPHFSVWSTFSFVCPIPWTCVQSKSQPSSQVYDSQCGHLSGWVQRLLGPPIPLLQP